MSDDITEGWGFPGLSKKAHYFRGCVSLCRKWMFLGTLEADKGKPSPDDCVQCSKKLRGYKQDNEQRNRNRDHRP